MSEDTEKMKKEKKVTKKVEKTEKKPVKSTEKVEKKDKTVKKVESSKEKKKVQSKKKEKIEKESTQNSVIENIKSFISKIIDMQEKVRQNEEEEKKQKKEEAEILEKEKQEQQTPKYLIEYYDLPFRYNETVIKILAQTPKRLFVYWDVADKDKETYLNAFGEHFFDETYPVLLLHNDNKDYTTEIPINDFANSWYLDISDPRDKYTIQLGRKFKSYIMPQLNSEVKPEEMERIHLNHDYLFIAISNKLEVPNDHILFEEFKPYVTYRNVKTHEEVVVDVTNTIFQNQLKEFYNELYDGQFDSGKFDMLNPSSIGTSGNFRIDK